MVALPQRVAMGVCGMPCRGFVRLLLGQSAQLAGSAGQPSGLCLVSLAAQLILAAGTEAVAIHARDCGTAWLPTRPSSRPAPPLSPFPSAAVRRHAHQARAGQWQRRWRWWQRGTRGGGVSAGLGTRGAGVCAYAGMGHGSGGQWRAMWAASGTGRCGDCACTDRRQRGAADGGGIAWGEAHAARRPARATTLPFAARHQLPPSTPAL